MDEKTELIEETADAVEGQVDRQDTAEERITYRDVLKQSNFRRSLLSGIFGRFADSVDSIAFTWLVYAVTESASWTAVIFAINKIPTVLLQPVAGVLVNRMQKKSVVCASNLLRAIAVAFIGVLYISRARITPWILVVFTLFISCVEAFELPAASAMTPRLLEKQYYNHAMSLRSSLMNVFELVGIAAAGIIIGLGGIGMAFLIDGAGFFLSALIFATIRVERETIEKVPLDLKTIVTELKEGLVYTKTNPVLFHAILFALIINALVVPINALQSAMAAEIFGMGSELLSIFGITLIIGMALGSIILPSLLKDNMVRRLIVVCGTIFGAAYCTIFFGQYTYGERIKAYAMVGVISIVIGVTIGIINSTLGIQFMKHVDEDYLSVAAATMNAGTAAATPVASFLVSAVTVFVPVSVMFLISGILCMIVFLAMGILRVRLE